jgi:hypothetical protein
MPHALRHVGAASRGGTLGVSSSASPWQQILPLRSSRGAQVSCMARRARTSSTAAGAGVAFDASVVRALSIDVMGALLTQRQPTAKIYADAALHALDRPPSLAELQPAVEQAQGEAVLMAQPCRELSSRGWWIRNVRRVLELSGRGSCYTDADFGRFFRRLHQHLSSPQAYQAQPDAASFLRWSRTTPLLLGVTATASIMPAHALDAVLCV